MGLFTSDATVAEFGQVVPWSGSALPTPSSGWGWRHVFPQAQGRGRTTQPLLLPLTRLLVAGAAGLPGTGRPRLGDRRAVRPDGLRPRALRDGDGGGHAPRTRASSTKGLSDANSRSWVLDRPGRLHHCGASVARRQAHRPGQRQPSGHTNGTSRTTRTLPPGSLPQSIPSRWRCTSGATWTRSTSRKGLLLVKKARCPVRVIGESRGPTRPPC